MRKNISVTNDRVLKILDSSPNFSKLIELAVLHYIESKEYMTRGECVELINSYFMANPTQNIESNEISKADLLEVLDL